MACLNLGPPRGYSGTKMVALIFQLSRVSIGECAEEWLRLDKTCRVLS